MQLHKPGESFVVKDATRCNWKFSISKDVGIHPDDQKVFYISVSKWETEKEIPFTSFNIITDFDSITRSDIFSAFMAKMSEIALAIVL